MSFIKCIFIICCAGGLCYNFHFPHSHSCQSWPFWESIIVSGNIPSLIIVEYRGIENKEPRKKLFAAKLRAIYKRNYSFCFSIIKVICIKANRVIKLVYPILLMEWSVKFLLFQSCLHLQYEKWGAFLKVAYLIIENLWICSLLMFSKWNTLMEYFKKLACMKSKESLIP